MPRQKASRHQCLVRRLASHLARKIICLRGRTNTVLPFGHNFVPTDRSSQFTEPGKQFLTADKRRGTQMNKLTGR